MAKRLSENLTSLYLGAAQRLKPKTARQKIVVYVESYDDVFFWRTVLDDFEDDSRYFEIMLPSRSTLGKGKKLVLTNKLGPQLGNYMIACVDADYDYLLQGATPTSRLINKNPFVFHTYAYAIENYQCYAATLHRVCVMATLNDRQIVDFESFMQECVPSRTDIGTCAAEGQPEDSLAAAPFPTSEKRLRDVEDGAIGFGGHSGDDLFVYSGTYVVRQRDFPFAGSCLYFAA